MPGDRSSAFVLEKAADGHVFAAGHGKAGNDVRCCSSSTRAERVDGGWAFTGHKIFGSLSPVWTYLGIHGMDVSDPANPRVGARLPAPRDRRLHGSSRPGTCSACWPPTMAAAASFDRPFVADENVALVCPAGFAGAGLFQVAVFAWALLGFANVYTGIAQRAYDLTISGSTSAPPSR